jgi:hypothetical protein
MPWAELAMAPPTKCRTPRSLSTWSTGVRAVRRSGEVMTGGRRGGPAARRREPLRSAARRSGAPALQPKPSGPCGPGHRAKGSSPSGSARGPDAADGRERRVSIGRCGPAQSRDRYRSSPVSPQHSISPSKPFTPSPARARRGAGHECVTRSGRPPSRGKGRFRATSPSRPPGPAQGISKEGRGASSDPPSSARLGRSSRDATRARGHI